MSVALLYSRRAESEKGNIFHFYCMYPLRSKAFDFSRVSHFHCFCDSNRWTCFFSFCFNIWVGLILCSCTPKFSTFFLVSHFHYFCDSNSWASFSFCFNLWGLLYASQVSSSLIFQSSWGLLWSSLDPFSHWFET